MMMFCKQIFKNKYSDFYFNLFIYFIFSIYVFFN